MRLVCPSIIRSQGLQVEVQSSPDWGQGLSGEGGGEPVRFDANIPGQDRARREGFWASTGTHYDHSEYIE